MDHIRSFPVIESHYCRSKTKRKYLESGLSINKMYQLFQEKIDKNDLALKSVSQYLYRKIFCEKFNISFFKPRKDQCAICERFINLSDTEKTEKETRLMSEHKRWELAAGSKKKMIKCTVIKILIILQQHLTCNPCYNSPVRMLVRCIISGSL